MPMFNEENDCGAAIASSNLCTSPGSGGIASVTSGDAKIVVDNTDPANPIISANGGTVTSVTAGAGMTQSGVSTVNPTLNIIANADGSIVAAANDIKVGVISDAQHGNLSGGSARHPDATGATAGFMTAAQFTKLAAYPASPSGSMYFGVGIQGDFTASNTTLAANVYARDYTIPNGVTVIASSFGVYCSGTFTGGATGVLQCDGAAGAAGGTGGAAGGTGSHGSGGGAGGAGGTAAGTAGTAPSSPCGGAGGRGGTGTGGAGGAGGAGVPSAGRGGISISTLGLQGFFNGTAPANAGFAIPVMSGGNGGGGGGGDGTAGAGGGGGGGIVFVSARTMTLAAGFTFSVVGGAGGTPAAGLRGGGGGGGGGLILLYYYFLNDSGAVYAVTGGAAGTNTSIALTVPLGGATGFKRAFPLL